MKKIILTTCFVLTSIALTAQTSYYQAVNDLQHYAQQVDMMYQQYYNWVAYNVSPYYQNSYYQSLNSWYTQQHQYCQNMSYQINSNAQAAPNEEGIDMSLLELLIDALTETPSPQENQNVRIKIPNTPAGWKK